MDPMKMTEAAAATIGAKQISLGLRVRRADGTIEDLGVVAYWHRNPLRRWAWRLGQLLRGRKPGRIGGRA